MMLVRISALIGVSAAVAWLALAGMPWLAQPGIDMRATGAIDRPQEAAHSDALLQRALEAIDEGDLTQARELQARMVPGSLQAHTLLWALARSGRDEVAASEIALAMDRLSDWPGTDILRAHYEAALSRERTPADLIVDYYSDDEPRTLAGALSLARAHLSLDDKEAARSALAPWWHDKPLEASTELYILSRFPDVLTKEDHRLRFLSMMYRDRISSAGRVAELAGLENYIEPWAAAIRRESGALKKLAKADKAFRNSPHHLFARIHYLRRMAKDPEAAKLLLESPVEEDALVDPDAWWTERRIVSRDAFEHDDPDTAYRIAAMHRGGSDETRVDAAFHAGWYALRGLKDPEKAIGHFQTIEEIAKGDISRSRGAYWLGRAHEAAGSRKEATEHYERAAEYVTTYYGQLARQRLRRNMDGLEPPAVTRNDAVYFERNEAASAMRKLEEIGQDELAVKLANDLGRALDNPAAIAQLVSYWEQRDQRYIALRMAKAANWRGVRIGGLTHPVGAIPASAPIEESERPLAYAVARQESEFNVGARSHANARGLMQLLPATAKEVARRAGFDYDPAALMTDGGYNAALGTAYLRQQLDSFGGSYVLTFIAYNAGPARAKEWIERFGDPRGKPLDAVVDWVEQIPFPETRHYVQRVMENMQVYKARLGLEPNISHDLRFGTNG